MPRRCRHVGLLEQSDCDRLDPQGRLAYTGDMGSFDERGYLTLRDRSKDVVISGGSNIYPAKWKRCC